MRHIFLLLHSGQRRGIESRFFLFRAMSQCLRSASFVHRLIVPSLTFPEDISNDPPSRTVDDSQVLCANA